MPYPTLAAHPSRRSRRRLHFGQFPGEVSSAGAGMFPDLGATPGSSLSDIVHNAATGNLTASQVATLKDQETQGLIQAGMEPNVAAMQAEQDVNSALSTFTAPGAFGVTWTGAQPGAANWATTLLESADPVFGIPWWVWAAGGGVLLLFLWKR